jgi:homogentisate 1,2-dioxygenase
VHNSLLPHGPDARTFEVASRQELKPVKLSRTLAFMFETRHPQCLTRYAAELPTLQKDYLECWSDLRKRFDPTREEWTEKSADMTIKQLPDR